MSKFSLSRKPEKLLVNELTGADNRLYRIDPCFRVVLSCLRVIGDPDAEPFVKALYVNRWFFLNHPPSDAWEVFSAFVRGDEPSGESEEPLLDFELDAGVIYASFRQQYHIDLLREDLHWVEFRALLGGLTEDTSFGQRVKVRGMDEEGLDEKGKAKLRKIKDMVAIQPKVSARERELRDELDRKLAAGEDPAEIIAQLQEA